MRSVPNPGVPGAILIADRLSETVIALDVVVDHSRQAADAAVGAHARGMSLLADIVCSELATDPDYRPSANVRDALGYPYIEGVLWSAAVRLGLLQTGQGEPGSAVRLVETDAGASCRILERIERVGGGISMPEAADR